MNKTGWIIFSTVVVLLLGSLVAWARITNPAIDVSGIDHNSVLAANAQSGNIKENVRGKADSKVLLVEYGDYQCPGCASASTNVNKLVEEYGDRIGFVFRNFPLPSIHANARTASASAEAAGLQGKFWEMHDLLYERQDDWSLADATKRTDLFKQYAVTIGINSDKFVDDLASSAVSKKINFDVALGKKFEVDATPTFFLGGEKLNSDDSGDLSSGNLDPIKAKIDELLKK